MTDKVKNQNDYNEIVVTGMSGQFPNSKNVKEFEYNLYNKINMMDDKETRWKHIYQDVPKVFGKIPHLNKFDHTFFGILQNQCDKMDCQMRILLEESYKAVMDAGINPSSLRNSKTGVYLGICFSETEHVIMSDLNTENGFGLLGTSRSLLANRISFQMGLNGPSLVCDTACSSSIHAMNLAYIHLRAGIIDAAIVGGSNILFSPCTTLQFAKLGVLSTTGMCRPYDEDANGYVRSEAVSCIFLQRKPDAKRIYATFVHSAANSDGFKQEGITYPSGTIQKQLITSFYDEVNIDMNEIGFFEAHSTGTVVGDPEECRAIDESVCRKRNKPLLVGSVKSNTGHAEASSGVVSMVKVLLAMNNNFIPPNINLSNLRKSIPALAEGRLKVVTEKTELTKPYIGINSFGFGGSNGHVLLKQFSKKRAISTAPITLPYLMIWSGRTEKSTNSLFDTIESGPLNLEHLALLRSSQAGGIQGMVYRGYSILRPGKDSTVSKPETLSRLVKHNDGAKHPMVWVFSGMGSQWTGMGKDLLKIKICAESILRSHTILKSQGVDLVNVLTSDDPKTYDNILHSFIGIAAIQIALVDLLRQLQINPDFIIGHSVGELGCAYADGCFTAEQTIMAAYYRGKVSTETDKVRGAMAAIGLGFKSIKPMLPPSIEVACHNNTDSCTITGPCADISSFVEVLQSKNIFAREVPCSNIAYHSRYISHFGPEFLKHLKQLIPNPKLRSNKWISTSVPSDKWILKDSQYSSAEYHTNNLLKSVLFEENSTYLPKNSLTIEIAPHALLQSILKTCIPDGIHIGLVRRNAKDNVLHLLESLGGIYANGYDLIVDALYPPIEWPVSRSTPTISDLIEFDHSYDHAVYYFQDECERTGTKIIRIKPNTDHKYLFGHKIDGRPLIPATFYLECVWRTFATMSLINEYETVDVEFENVQFLRATTLSTKDQIELTVCVQRGTGAFEISESKTLVATGTIRALTGTSQPTPIFSDDSQDTVQLVKRDFYKELKLRGYHYEGDFQSVELASADGSFGKVKWINNWVTFLDCILQLIIIRKDSRSLMLPVKLRSMRIFSNYHKSLCLDSCDIGVYSSSVQNRVVAGGIEITDLTASSIQRRKPPGEPVLEKYQFISYLPAPKLSVNDISRCCIQLMLENQTTARCSIAELVKAGENDGVYLDGLIQAIDSLPTIQGSYESLHMNVSDSVQNNENEQASSFITRVNSIEEMSGNVNILVVSQSDFGTHSAQLLPKLTSNGMILIKTTNQEIPKDIGLPQDYQCIAFFPCSNNPYSILTVVQSASEPIARDEEEEVFVKISQYDHDFQWIEQLKSVFGKRIILVSENEPINGLIGLVNCLRMEPETKNVRCVFIDDLRAPAFDPALAFYKNQLQLGLAVNVYRKGQWGGYRHLELAPACPVLEQEGHIRGAIGYVGDFSSLHWQQGPLTKDNLKLRVFYSALNFRDVMHASGRLSVEDAGISRLDQLSIFGLEYSGINLETGKATMGMLLCSAIASHIEKEPMISWEVPSKWSLREAASVPVVYITVYFAFFYTADIREGKTILIHSGSGGVGIAAIRTAIAYGLEVFTTVSTPEKKAFLLKMFPELKEQNIGNSRDCSFEDMIRIRTRGRGVDFVLNSLSEDKLKASLRCLAPKGHFLEIGKFDMANDSSIGLGVFFKGQSFHAVLADKLGEYGRELTQKIENHIKIDIEKGIIQPLPTTVFKPAELEKAFRFLMTAKHIGKVLIEMRPDIESPATHPISAVPKMYFANNLSYVIPGGLGGFGLELVDWMIIRGARKIVLNSRRGISDDYQKLRISIWKNYSCEVVVNTSDISTESGCLDLLMRAMKLGPVGGILNLAVLLKDGIFSNQTGETFQQSLAPKAIATKYLDKLSRKLCPKLHCFVVFSSVSCGRGNAGQTNYGMANSTMERIVEDRVAIGLPGKAIQWGAVGEVGLVAIMAEGKIDLDIGGTLQQRISSCLDVLDTLMTSPDAIVSSMVVAEKKIVAEGQTALQYVLNTLSISDLKLVSLSSTLAELGMDSLMGVEIKQTLERTYDIVLSPAEVRSLTIERVKELSATNKAKVTTSDDTDFFSDMLKKLYGNLSLQSMIVEDLTSVNNIDSNEVPIIIFPGIEGICTEVWRNIGMDLSVPAYVMQYLIKFQARKFHQLVELSVNTITKLLEERKTKSFRIVAFSFGTLVAHGTIKHLENLGYSGTSIYIDGSPLWMEIVGSGFRKLNSLDVDKHVVMNTLKFVLSKDEFDVANGIMLASDNREILMNNIRQVLQKTSYHQINETIQYISALVYAAEIASDPETYKAIDTIQSKLLLIKPTELTVDQIDQFYGLKPITRNSIEEITIEGNHQTILQNEKVSGLVNKYFGVKIN